MKCEHELNQLKKCGVDETIYLCEKCEKEVDEEFFTLWNNQKNLIEAIKAFTESPQYNKFHLQAFALILGTINKLKGGSE